METWAESLASLMASDSVAAARLDEPRLFFGYSKSTEAFTMFTPHVVKLNTCTNTSPFPDSVSCTQTEALLQPPPPRRLHDPLFTGGTEGMPCHGCSWYFTVTVGFDGSGDASGTYSSLRVSAGFTMDSLLQPPLLKVGCGS